MLRKLWYTIIESWNTFWEQYEMTYEYEINQSIPEIGFIKPPFI